MELKRIHELRREKKISMVKLAASSGVSRFKIARMEDRGVGQYNDVVKVLEALGFEIKLQLK